MAFNFSNIGSFFEQIDTAISVVFILNGKEYEVEQFKTEFSQAVDHKGQPQHETMGGLMYITMTQGADYNIYDWAKREDRRNDGAIRFKTKSTGTILEILFENSQCVRLTRSINFSSGTKTTLVISPQRVKVNGFTHNNRWREN